MFIKIHDKEYWHRFMQADVLRYEENAKLNSNIVITFKKDCGVPLTLEFANNTDRDAEMKKLDAIFGVQ